MFIRPQKIVRDENGVIRSGSASLVKNEYVPNPEGNHKKSHSKQVVVERLGEVIWMPPDDKRQGIFNSPTRGLVFYDLNTDVFKEVNLNDERLAGTSFEPKPVRLHTNFGLPSLFFSEMEKTHLMNVLRSTFQDERFFEKVLAHIAHDCLKNSSAVKCYDFVKSSALSYILNNIPISTLNCDSNYYAAMSDDTIKVSYFRNLIQEMRKTHPNFGKACYVDSTPLPGEAENNPFVALCSHGTNGAMLQSRLVLILDIETGYPIWFEVIPGNVLDKSTLEGVCRDVKATLGVDILELDLDAGYAKKELFDLYNIDNNFVISADGEKESHTVLVRMPDLNGYPHDDLYISSKPNFYDPDYEFDYEHHTFFGERYEVNLWENREYAFVYVDKTQASKLLREWRTEHPDAWSELSHTSKEWYVVKDGFFILIGNRDQNAKEALTEYRGRTHIETFFRDGKTYLSILPIAKWNKSTVLGKILHDVIETTFYREFRKQVASLSVTMSTLLTDLNSWECVKIDDEVIELKTPSADVRRYFEELEHPVTGHIALPDWRNMIFKGIKMPEEPVTRKAKKAGRKSAVKISLSPEEKREAEAQKRAEREHAKAEEKERKAKEREAEKERRAQEREAKKKAEREQRAQEREAKKNASRKAATSKE